jgi:hypothetical protein
MDKNPYEAPHTPPPARRSTTKRVVLGVVIALITIPVAIAVAVIIYCANNPFLGGGH